MTPTQIAAIIMLLQVFGVGQSTINEVRADLAPRASYVAPVVQTPIQAPNTPVVPVLGAIGTSTPVCDDTPTFNITPTLTTNWPAISSPESESLNNLSVSVNGTLNFATSLSDDCGGNWLVWLDTQNNSNYDNIYGAPSYNAENVAATASQPLTYARKITYSPISAGTYTLTFYAGNGTATTSAAYSVNVSAN